MRRESAGSRLCIHNGLRRGVGSRVRRSLLRCLPQRQLAGPRVAVAPPLPPPLRGSCRHRRWTCLDPVPSLTPSPRARPELPLRLLLGCYYFGPSASFVAGAKRTWSGRIFRHRRSPAGRGSWRGRLLFFLLCAASVSTGASITARYAMVLPPCSSRFP